MTAAEILGLSLAGCLAGGMNAIAGGGTLVTFPVLLFFGIGSIVANATSTLALLIGNVGGLFGFRKQFGGVKLWLVYLLPVSALGGWVGSIILTRSSEAFFARLVPFLVLFATILFFLQNAFRRRFILGAVEPDPKPPTRIPALASALAFQFAVAVYGGFFGAGIGILMLAALGILGLRDIHEMNAVKTLLGFVINAIATIWFIRSDLIAWPQAGVMTVGALIGYYFAAHYSQRIPQRSVRRLVTLIGFAISAVMFWRQFFG